VFGSPREQGQRSSLPIVRRQRGLDSQTRCELALHPIPKESKQLGFQRRTTRQKTRSGVHFRHVERTADYFVHDQRPLVPRRVYLTQARHFGQPEWRTFSGAWCKPARSSGNHGVWPEPLVGGAEKPCGAWGEVQRVVTRCDPMEKGGDRHPGRILKSGLFNVSTDTRTGPQRGCPPRPHLHLAMASDASGHSPSGHRIIPFTLGARKPTRDEPAEAAKKPTNPVRAGGKVRQGTRRRLVRK